MEQMFLNFFDIGVTRVLSVSESVTLLYGSVHVALLE